MNDEKLDQDARGILIDHYGSHLRHWGTILIALIIALFTASQSKIFLSIFYELVIVLIIIQLVYAFLRILCYGGLLQYVPSATPLPQENYGNFKKNETATYLYRLEQGVFTNFKNKKAIVNLIPLNNILFNLSKFRYWFLTILIPFFIWIFSFTLIFGIVKPVETGETEIHITTWLMAIGPFVVSTVAFIVAFLPSIRNWYNRPIFEVEFENKEPFCRKAVGNNAGIASFGYYIRLRVRNKGRSIARGCEGKLIKITQAKDKVDRTDFDPVVLHWVGSAKNQLDINSSEYEYLDIAYAIENDVKRLYIYHTEKLPRGINLTPPRQDYIFHIELYGENIKPISKKFYLKNNPEFNKIVLKEL